MESGLVSVMMPAWNAARYIAEAVTSVLSQSYRKWELLVVDDGSTDGTAQKVAAFGDPRIRLSRKENGGESSARNVALDMAAGEFIAYLDADDVYLPQHLAVTVSFLRANPHRDGVYTDGFHIDPSGRRLVSLQSRRRGPFEGRVYDEVVRASDVFGPPACVVLRHEIVERHRLRYDPRIVIGPDWDFFVRFADVATFGFIAEKTCLYRVHQANITAAVGQERRRESLAICREKAIGMDSFSTCPVVTRAAVFYDLLVNLLSGQTERRRSIIESRQFASLPSPERARLVRLMAVDALTCDGPGDHVGEWFRLSTELAPSDRKSSLLLRAYGLSPILCRAALLARSPSSRRRRGSSPFADLEGAGGKVA